MEQGKHEKEEHWQGALHSEWREDAAVAPQLTWEQLSPHVLRKNRKRRVLGFISLMLMVVFGLGYFIVAEKDVPPVEMESAATQNSVTTGGSQAPTEKSNGVSKASSNVVQKDNSSEDAQQNQSKDADAEREEKRKTSVSSVHDSARNADLKEGEREPLVKESIGERRKQQSERQSNIFESGQKVKNGNALNEDGKDSSTAMLQKGWSEDSKQMIERAADDSALFDPLIIASKPLYALPIHTQFSIKIPAPVKYRKPIQFSYQLGVETGRSIRIVKGNYDGEGVQSRAVGAKRWFLPKRLVHASMNWHWTENFSLQWGCQWGGGDIQSRWVFRNLSVEPNTQELRMQSSDGDVVTNDPSLIDQITNGNGGVYQLRLNYSYRMLTVPIGVRYRMTNQVVSPMLRLGWNWERIGRREMSIDVNENGVIRNIPLVITAQQPRRSMQQYCALGVSMRLHERFEFYTEGIYYFPLTKMINANGYQVRSSGIGIQWGLQYRWH